jgi:chromosome partitioning protein
MPEQPAIGVTLTAFKGGQAKSTTAVNLAVLLAKRGLSTLLVDCDPQCNSSGLFVRWDEVKYSLRSAIVPREPGEKPVPIESVIQPTRIPNLAVLPASFELSLLDKEMVVSANGHTRIQRALRPIQNAYQFIVFDTAPGLSHLTLGALAASRYFVIPIAPEVWAGEGLRLFMQWIQEQQAEEVFDAQLLGLLATRVEHGTRISRTLLQQLRANHAYLPAFETSIPKRVGNEDAVQARAVAGEPASDPDITAAYERFVIEALKRIDELEGDQGRHRG